MFDVQKVDRRNKRRFIQYAQSDVIKHVFAFYDIQHDPEHTTMHIAFKEDKVVGYILTYTATDVPSVVLECEKDVAKKLIAYTPENNFIMHTPPDLRQVAESRFPNAKSYLENWMLVRKHRARLLGPELARRLRTEEDAASLAKLVLGRKDRPNRGLRRYIDWVNKMPLYGVFKNNELVSYAGSFIQLPQVWMIGGVYTHPKHRNKGYALLATSAITKEALDNAEVAALFVRSDNHPAIKVYEKIGYKKIGEKLWVDVGTGLKP